MSDGFDGRILTMNVDSTEDPKMLLLAQMVNKFFQQIINQDKFEGQGNLSMNRLSKPFDMTSVEENRDLSCNVIDAFRVKEMHLAGDG